MRCKVEEIAALSAMCYYAGAPFQVPAVVLPFVHTVMFAVPKPHSSKWRGVSGLSLFNEWVIPRHFKMEGLHSLRGLLHGNHPAGPYLCDAGSGRA